MRKTLKTGKKMKNIENAQIGDTLVVCYGSAKSIREVTRITKTMIIVFGHIKYRKSDGHLVGGDSWDTNTIRYPHSEMELYEIRQETRLSHMCSKLEKHSWITEDRDLIVKIAKMVGIT